MTQVKNTPEQSQEGYVLAKGTRFYYQSRGSGPLVLLLHGFPQDHHCWHKLIGDISQTHRTVTLDLKGYGKSGKPEKGYSLKILTAEIAAVIETLGYEKAIVFGHDWGGVLAFWLALAFPERVERLVVFNAPFHKISLPRSWYVAFFNLPFLPELLFTLGNDFFIKKGLAGAAYDFKRTFSPSDLKHYQTAFRLPGVKKGALAYYRNVVRMKFEFSALLNTRGVIDVPTWLIWGVNDPILVPAVLTGIENHFSDIQINFIPFSGHWVMEEQPEACLKVLLPILQIS